MRLGTGIAGLCIGSAAACLRPGPFACSNDDQCSHAAEGICEAEGQCSYRDDGCPSGRRYSEFAAAPGCAASSEPACVGEAHATDSDDTGTVAITATVSDGSGDASAGDTSSGDSGAPAPATCDMVDCSTAGRCVVVDGAATCACDPGLYAVGLQCLEDPCASVACRFLDAARGDDAAEGTREAPWRTLARLREALFEAGPGDHFLLRRGATWDAALDIDDARGSLDAPIVIGAYGPSDEPKPRLRPGAVAIDTSEHLVLRDLAIEDDPTVEMAPNRPCLLVQRSQHIAVHDNEISHCNTRAIRVSEASAYTVIARNELREVGNKAAIFVSDITWVDPPLYVGSHHWLVDNLVVGSGESTVEIEVGSGVGDVKTIGNVVTDAMVFGVSSRTSGFAWVTGNVVARAAALDATYGGGINASGGSQHVGGNVVLASRSGIRANTRGLVSGNTVIVDGGTAGLELDEGSDALEVIENLVLARGGAPSVRIDGTLEGAWLAAMDRNTYAHDAGDACGVWLTGTLHDLAAWQALSGLDASSACGEVSGFGDPPVDLDPADWDDAFWDALTPDPGWRRCDEAPGAYTCDGEPRARALPPFDDFFEGEGLGWAGPLLVRQLYDVGS